MPVSSGLSLTGDHSTKIIESAVKEVALRAILHLQDEFAPVHVFAKEIEDHRALFYYFRLDFFVEIGQVFDLAFTWRAALIKSMATCFTPKTALKPASSMTFTYLSIC